MTETTKSAKYKYEWTTLDGKKIPFTSKGALNKLFLSKQNKETQDDFIREARRIKQDITNTELRKILQTKITNNELFG